MSKARIFSKLVSMLFVGLIALPLAARLVGVGQPSKAENRRLTGPPSWPQSAKAIKSFPGKFEAYFDDHFSFRPWLVRTHQRLKVFGLGMSSSDEVLKGKDGWYFYTGNQIKNEDPLLDYRAIRPLSEDHLKRWQRVLEERRDWLAERNIAYLVVLVPNKARVYPEVLPESVQPEGRLGPYDQLTAHLARHSTLNVLDVAPALREAKSIGRLYHKLDPHWNAVGGFVGYREVMKKLQACGVKVQEPFTFDDVVMETGRYDEGSLPRLMGVEGLLVEDQPLVKPQKALTFSQQKLGKEEWSFLTRVNNPELPTGMVMGDSFIGGFAPFISEHFEWFIYHPTYNKFDAEEVERRKPDIVIEEVVERFLRDKMSNPPELAKEF